jgi:hypothetical protein
MKFKRIILFTMSIFFLSSSFMLNASENTDQAYINNFIANRVKCNPKNLCENLRKKFVEFEKLTKVRFQISANQDTKYIPLSNLTDAEINYLETTLNRPMAIILAYYRLNNTTLTYINLFKDINLSAGEYIKEYKSINTRLLNSNNIITHEIGHAYSPLITEKQQINAFEYFFGPNLIDLNLDKTDDTKTEEGLQDYLLNLGRNNKRVTFKELKSIDPIKRLEFLKSFKRGYSEIQAVPMESLNIKNGNQNYEKLQLKQIVLLSKGNHHYLTDEFLVIINPLLNPDQAIDLIKLNNQLNNYFFKMIFIRNPIISPKLIDYYNSAIQLGLLNSNK